MEGHVGEGGTETMLQSAGLVPRAVAQVFKHLEENDIEYQVTNMNFRLCCTSIEASSSSDSNQVRISVVELYNEDLSDLIAEDESSGKLRKLRLLEDPKKGVILQVPLHDQLGTLPQMTLTPPLLPTVGRGGAPGQLRERNLRHP
jgi:hypothetical protein